VSLDISSSKSRTFQPQHPLESTRFPMARARTPLLSLGRLRTRNTQQRSSTNVTRHGAASLLEIAQPRPLPTRSQCELTLFVVPDTKTKSIYKKSRNLTQSSSPGLVTRNDPVYANLPADSRQPPAPIDPSSKRFFLPFALIAITPFPRSLEVVLHLIRPGLEEEQRGKTMYWTHKYKMHLVL